MIKVTNLRFGYGERGDIFDDFSVSMKKGEAWTIIGPSGCGKTTLLFLIAGLNTPAGGMISVGGQKIHRPRPRTGLVLQDHGLLPWATIFDNVRLGLEIRHFYGPDGKHSPADIELDQKRDRERVAYWLDRLNISNLQEMYPAQLSRGQRQRAAIARTLVMEPDMLLMDEPFSALDAPIREELQKVMNGFHREEGLTSLTVTHDIEEAVVLGEKILVLQQGCNVRPLIVDNHLLGEIDRKSDPEFVNRCSELRRLIAGAGEREGGR
ncbi:ABC transporter ATP-binding protein [Desulforhopalus singaporensis]|uniref:NitT/TauT family transport system ATP-binding protein n=1 Tax=Desulforhopalus singaporensis TaxID=91360 RepID=A0A1H0KQH1_9BACT|nr:ABC transporter ATP-binding protein [Desulforhopalus singaporensis]SDO58021.1 NitT/TauT family transport system ATP-binding protein [Desulforhopalus singaporensis]